MQILQIAGDVRNGTGLLSTSPSSDGDRTGETLMVGVGCRVLGVGLELLQALIERSMGFFL